MMPLQPSEFLPIWADARIGVEVCTFDKRGNFSVTQVDCDNAICRLVVIFRMILADRYQPIARTIVNEISETQLTFRRNWLWLLARGDLPNPLIRIVGEVYGSLVNRDRSAAIFMDRGAGAKWFWQHVLGRAIGRTFYYDVPAFFFRSSFDPVNGIAIGGHIAKTHRPLDEHFCGNGRSP